MPETPNEITYERVLPLLTELDAFLKKHAGKPADNPDAYDATEVACALVNTVRRLFLMSPTSAKLVIAANFGDCAMDFATHLDGLTVSGSETPQ